MKRKIGALLAGGLTLVISSLLTPATLHSSTTVLSSYFSITTFLGSLVTGYLVRQKGWLYGLLLVAITLLIPMIIVFGNIGFLLINSRLQRIPFRGDFGEFGPFVFKMIFEIIIPWLLLGAFGGFVGEILYRMRKKS